MPFKHDFSITFTTLNNTVLFNVPRANMLAVLKSASLMSYNYTGEQQQGGLLKIL